MVHCSGACGDKGGRKKGQGGLGLAIRETITRAIVRLLEFLNERLLRVSSKLRCRRASAVSFLVAYGPTECTRDESKKRPFWAALVRVVKEVSKHEELFVLMDANAWTGRRGGGMPGSQHYGVLGAYGWDARNDNGEHRLAFASNHHLALLNTFPSTPQNGISHNFNGVGNWKRIDYIFTRHRDRKLVRNVVVHPQPLFIPISDHSAVVAYVRLLGRFARNRPVRRDKKSPLNRRRLTTDPQIWEVVATAVGARLRALPSRDTNYDAAFATATLQAAEALVPQIKRTTLGRG